MNIFDLMGISAPVEEKKTEKKTEKKSNKNSKLQPKNVKNMIKLPGRIFVQGSGKMLLDQDSFDGKTEITDVELKEFLIKKFMMPSVFQSVKIDDNTCIFGLDSNSGKTGNFTVGPKTFLSFDDKVILLNEDGQLEESNANSADIAKFAEMKGLLLGDPDKVRFVKNDDELIPIPATTSDERRFEELTFPFTIHFYGIDWEDICVSEDMIDSAESEDSSEDTAEDSSESIEIKISSAFIRDTIIKKYPEFKDRCDLTVVSNTTVCVNMSISSLSSSTQKKSKDEIYTINNDTVIKFYGMTVETGLEPGDYTAKQICSAMTKAGIVECKTPSSIIMKKMGNVIMAGVKFGGTKGGDFLTNRELNTIRQPFSTFEKKMEDRYLKVHPAWLFEQNGNSYRFSLRLPKVPKDIYNKLVSVFKTVGLLHNKECLCRIYWDMEKNCYDLVFPYQKASIADVKVTRPEDEMYLLTHIPVAELHSHGRAYDAFFSGIDDADECSRYGIFGVFSFCLDNESEKALFRCCSGSGRTLSLLKDDLFEEGDFEYELQFVKKILSSNRFE